MNSPELSRNSEVFSRGVYNGGIKQEEMSGRLFKLKEEDDEDEIIAGKFSPCGGECEQGTPMLSIFKTQAQTAS